MGYIKNICVGAAVVGSALLGYVLYKNLFQSKQNMDGEQDDQLNTESKDKNSTKNTNEVVDDQDVNKAQCSSSHQSKTKSKSNLSKNQPRKPKTGYMGLRKGFLMK